MAFSFASLGNRVTIVAPVDMVMKMDCPCLAYFSIWNMAFIKTRSDICISIQNDKIGIMLLL